MAVRPVVISEWSPEAEHELVGTFGQPGQDMVGSIALDAEGVDLSRLGRISIVQISTPEQCFILDVLDKGPEDPLVGWLRGILEGGVTKIIHDCRMDSDALLHHLNIRLTAVHDTACWHSAVTGQPDTNLNDTLSHNGLPANAARDKNIYSHNHAFWATRPLTDVMVEWAAGDLLSLFALRDAQMDAATDESAAVAARAQENNIEFARSAQVDTVRVMNPGRFIGPRGSSIRRLQQATGALIYGKGRRGDNMFMVYYTSAQSLAQVRRQAAS